MRKLYTVSEVSEITKISPRTLRYYDKINLLKPAVIDESSRSKYYTYGQLEALNIIMLCSDMGMSSREMRTIAAQKGTETFPTLMEEGVKLAKERIEALRTTMLHIEDFSEQVERYHRGRYAKGIYRRSIDRRCIAILPCKENDSDEELNNKSTELYRIATEKGMALSYNGGVVGVSNGESIGWFVYLERLEDYEDDTLILNLPQGNYDCRIVPNAESRAAYIAGTCSAEGYDFKKGSVVVFAELYDYQNSSDNLTEIQILLKKDKNEK